MSGPRDQPRDIQTRIPRDIQTRIGYYSFETGQKPFVFTRERHEHEKDQYKGGITFTIQHNFVVKELFLHWALGWFCVRTN